jgi:hypothetical protein
MISELTLVVFWVISSFFIGLFCMAMAEAKNRNPWLWLLLGWLFGWIALIAIAGFPVKDGINVKY